MTAKHTPGPWHFRPTGHLINGAWIVAENGTRIANVSRGADKSINQKLADGLLIASAPDLYADLAVLVKAFGQTSDHGLWVRARDTLTRTRGEP